MDINKTSSPIFFFLPDVVGGVSSVITNIAVYAGQGKPVKIIACSDRRLPRTGIDFPRENFVPTGRFVFDSYDNLYYTAKKLRKELDGPGPVPVIVATDAPELQMIQLTALDTKTIFIVLGDFEHYYQLAQQHQGIIDGFIAISREIHEKLVQLLPGREDSIHLAYFPTPVVHASKSEYRPGRLRAVYVGRLDDGKNPLLLPEIDRMLRQENIIIEWTIVGDGPLREPLKELIRDRGNFVLKGLLSNEELHKVYMEQDVLIMPSKAEGLPVSLIESMKSAIVPVVSNISGGVREIVRAGINGFLCDVEKAGDFADCLKTLYRQPELYGQYSAAAKSSVDQQFDPYRNSKRYFDLIESIPHRKGSKKFSLQTNRLDKPWLPNSLVKYIRAFSK